MPGAVVLLVAATLGGDLPTAAKLSARPAACAPASAASSETGAPGAWDQMRERGRQQLCQRLARAQLELGARPGLALRLAKELSGELPERAEPWTLQARAQTRLRAFAEAWSAWQQAERRGEDLRAPHVLRDHARSAALTGHREAALADYRKLLPLLQAWSDPIEQQAVYLEAASAALQRGPEGLDEAGGLLTVARAGATSSGLRAYVAGLSALWAARRGASAPRDSRLAAAEVWRFVELVQADRWPKHWPEVPPHEVLGAAALLVEPYSAVVAEQLWQEHARGLESAGAHERWRALAVQPLSAVAGQVRSPVRADQTPAKGGAK
jgi:tetratricopeptide (TPR) repeat protein